MRKDLNVHGCYSVGIVTVVKVLAWMLWLLWQVVGPDVMFADSYTLSLFAWSNINMCIHLKPLPVYKRGTVSVASHVSASFAYGYYRLLPNQAVYVIIESTLSTSDLAVQAGREV